MCLINSHYNAVVLTFVSSKNENRNRLGMLLAMYRKRDNGRIISTFDFKL